MKADSISLIIAASGGFILGSLIWLRVCGAVINQVRRRVEKDSWAAANRYYTRKEAAP